MHAIAGLHRLDGEPADRAAAERMLAAGAREVRVMADGATVLGGGLVGPGDARGVAAVHASGDGRVVLAGDLRLDNRDELAADLGLGPAEVTGWPDAAFVLAAYEAWGTACTGHLRGAFTFLLWDGPRQRLLAARDPMGHRVLYVHRTAGRLALANRLTALLALPDCPARLNRRKVALSLVLLQATTETYFEGITKLPGGHRLVVDGEGIREECYWSPRPSAPLRLGSDDAYVEAFLDVFDRAVADACRIPGTPGMMLSAGLDSTAVATSAARQLGAQGKALHAWHAAPRAGFDGRVPGRMVPDESADVASLCAGYPAIQLEVLREPRLDLLEDMEAVFGWTGAPIRNPNNWGWFHGIYQAARAAGCEVLLSGSMGNVTISHTGARVLRDTARAGDWSRLWAELDHLRRTRGHLSTLAEIRDRILLPLAPLALDRAWGRVTGRRVESLVQRSASAIRPALVEALDLEGAAQAMGRDVDGWRRAGGADLRLTTILGEGDAWDVLNGLRAWHGIETRDPTADARVVSFCLAIPESQYRRFGEGRWLVRRAMRGRVPDGILDRGRLGAQGADWMDWFHDLRPTFVADLDAMRRCEAACDLLDLPALDRLLADWPARFGPEHEVDYKLRFLRGLMMGRFLCWFERTWS